MKSGVFSGSIPLISGGAADEGKFVSNGCYHCWFSLVSCWNMVVHASHSPCDYSRKGPSDFEANDSG